MLVLVVQKRKENLTSKTYYFFNWLQGRWKRVKMVWSWHQENLKYGIYAELHSGAFLDINLSSESKFTPKLAIGPICEHVVMGSPIENHRICMR